MKIKKRLHPTFYFFLLSTALVASAVVLEFVASELNDVKAESQILPFVESQADSVLRLSIATNEIAYNTRDRMIYATRPSSAGEGGNSLTRIDPLTGEVGASVFVGSEPNKVVIADDGQTIYVSLDGSYAIRRYDAFTQTPGIVFSVGRNTSGAFGIGTPFLARDIAVAPGDPDRLAVSRQMPGISPGGEGTVIFDNGVPLPLIGPGHSETPAYLAFSSSASVLYGGTYDAGLRTLSVSSNGVTDTGARTSFSPLKIVYEDGRIFDTKGHVIDAETRTLLGTCVGVVHQPNYLSNTAFVPDTATGRVLYAVKTGNSIIIKAFDLNTFLEIGTMTVPNTGSDNFPTALIRYGTNGLAMRTTDNDLFLIQTALLPTANPLPVPTTTPAAPTPTPTPHSKFIRQLELRNRDLLYQPADRKFYASVPNTAGDPHANSLVRIEPSTAAIESSFQLGNNPGRLAFSEDAQILYAGIDGENSVRKFDMRTQTAVSQFPLGVGLNGPKTAYDIEILPNDSNAVAVSYGSSGYNYDGVDIYDNGVKRAQKADRAGEITVVSPQSLLIGETYMSKHTISTTGLTLEEEFTVSGIGAPVIVGNRLYTSGGNVVDLTTKDFLGTFAGVGYWAGVTVDEANNRIFFLSNGGSGEQIGSSIRAYRLDNFTPIGTIRLPNIPISQPPRRFFRWGQNGLAFSDNQDKIYFLQSDLVSSEGVVPTGLSLSAQNREGNEAFGSFA